MKEKKNTTPAEEEKNEAATPIEETPTQESQTPAPESTDEDKLQEMGEKLAKLNDKYLLLYADYENFRRRTAVEKADLLLNGSRDMMKAILPVVDDFERALAASEGDEGVQLIYNKLVKILEQKGLKAMTTKGEKFDDSLHEAVTQIPAPTPEQKGLVVDEVLKGYFLNDKVLRYAKVVVAC